jgi:hypothetical protein
MHTTPPIKTTGDEIDLTLRTESSGLHDSPPDLVFLTGKPHLKRSRETLRKYASEVAKCERPSRHDTVSKTPRKRKDACELVESVGRRPTPTRNKKRREAFPYKTRYPETTVDVYFRTLFDWICAFE